MPTLVSGTSKNTGENCWETLFSSSSSMSLGPRWPAPLLIICQLQTALRRNNPFEPPALHGGAFVHPSTSFRSKYSFINCIYWIPLSWMDKFRKHLTFCCSIQNIYLLWLSSDHFCLLHYTSIQKIICCAVSPSGVLRNWFPRTARMLRRPGNNMQLDLGVVVPATYQLIPVTVCFSKLLV